MAKVLIVEDHASLARLYTFYMESAGHYTISAATAERGISLFKSETPDLVIVDVSLPDMDGHQFISILQELNPQAKIVALYFDPGEEKVVPRNVTSFSKDTRRPQFVELVNYALTQESVQTEKRFQAQQQSQAQAQAQFQAQEQSQLPQQLPAVVVSTSERGTILIRQNPIDGSDGNNCLEILPDQVDGLVAWLTNSLRILSEQEA